MSDPADRIRRVLSDGLPAVPPPAALPRRTLQAVPEALRQRLEDLEAGQGRPDLRGPPAPRARSPLRASGADADDPSAVGPPALGPEPGDPAAPALEARLGARPRATALGEFLEVERRVPLSARHGRVRLADALAHPVPLRDRDAPAGGLTALRAADAVFLDTETTGLAGGTGTVAFLVGAGFVEGEHFVVRQYFLRDFPEEAALLGALRADLGDRPVVSFNGRSFDWPLLTTRWRLNRRAHERAGWPGGEPSPPAHLDLLLTARRLWASTLHSHALAALERHVLGLARGEDLGGWQIPMAWFDYLRGGDRLRVAEAFRHNQIDVVSMLALMGEAGRILAAPGAQLATPGDRLGTARLLLELGDEDGARACLGAGIAEADAAEGRPLHLLLGWIERRAGRDAEALAHYERAAALAPPGEVDAHEQVAKLLEHRRRDYAGARRYARAALAQVPPGSSAARALEHRLERLDRRMARRAAEGQARGPGPDAARAPPARGA